MLIVVSLSQIGMAHQGGGSRSSHRRPLRGVSPWCVATLSHQGQRVHLPSLDAADLLATQRLLTLAALRVPAVAGGVLVTDLGHAHSRESWLAGSSAPGCQPGGRPL